MREHISTAKKKKRERERERERGGEREREREREKKEEAKAGNEGSNIIPKFLQAKKKPPPPSRVASFSPHTSRPFMTVVCVYEVLVARQIEVFAHRVPTVSIRAEVKGTATGSTSTLTF